ncbi:hypothetical protein EHO60_11620 [Leptospira fletcheri]|uniref:Uncharacterized protein n=1 Tax=Leptospira fletcheri TaxID=2484981 RepID=A0A4R9GFR4_9LEPT|nr:hypothetical protein [Leptospira fletcheri]TGK09997.1 hypothetical protein EHO60_11620 [Leptospira fletcheri]
MKVDFIFPSPQDLPVRNNSEEQDPSQPLLAALEWGKENGADSVSFLPIGTEGWSEISRWEQFPLRMEIVQNKKALSDLLPPLVFQNRLLLWTHSREPEIADTFFLVSERIKKFREQASELLELPISSFPKVSWTEDSEGASILLSDLWESRKGSRIRSKNFILPEAFLFASSAQRDRIPELRWTELEDETITLVGDFISRRSLGKYGHVLQALSSSEITKENPNTRAHHPRKIFSVPFQLLLSAAISAEAWERLVSYCLEERPPKAAIAERLKAWTEKQPETESDSGIHSLFEERTILLVDKFTGRNDRKLPDFLEKEFRKTEETRKRKRETRLREIEEELLPRQLLLVEAQSKFEGSHNDRKLWEEFGNKCRQKLESLLSEQRNLSQEGSSSNGRKAEDWDHLV